MVIVELAEEVITDAVVALALDVECLLDELEIFLVVFLSKSHAKKSLEAFCNVIREPVSIEE